jgi:hypothetical protein
MHAVPITGMSHVISIDEPTYGGHLDQQIIADLQTTYDPAFRGLRIDDIFKMIAISLNLFQLCPLYRTPYFITEELDIAHHYPNFFKNIKIEWETWDRYAPSYDLTANGKITCDDIVKAVRILEKYYRYNYWLGNKVAVALHNFWNALFITERTLAFLALVIILETFTKFGRSRDFLHNIRKLVPRDAHGNDVTIERLEEMRDARNIIVHGSYGRSGHATITWAQTHLDAKFSNVDVHLSSGVMSIAVKMLQTVIFDARLMSIIENAETSKKETWALRGHLENIHNSSE